MEKMEQSVSHENFSSVADQVYGYMNNMEGSIRDSEEYRAVLLKLDEARGSNPDKAVFEEAFQYLNSMDGSIREDKDFREILRVLDENR